MAKRIDQLHTGLQQFIGTLARLGSPVFPGIEVMVRHGHHNSQSLAANPAQSSDHDHVNKLRREAGMMPIQQHANIQEIPVQAVDGLHLESPARAVKIVALNSLKRPIDLASDSFKAIEASALKECEGVSGECGYYTYTEPARKPKPETPKP